ncbi:MAG: hypothetical protein QM765_50640 [Myxococcales bacterium]
MKIKVFADYHQFHLRDGEKFGDISDGWTAQATEDRVAVADHVVGIGTVSDGDVLVTVEVLDAQPELDLAKAEHATEASLRIESGALAVLGCTDEYAKARRIKVANGWWRIRTLLGGLGKARETARILMWKEARARAPKVLQRWSPPAAKPPKPAKSPKNTKLAAALARFGQTDGALEALTRFADAGDLVASAALAELHAFRGEWASMVPRAEAFFADPGVVYAGNVFTDLTRLFRRAARELRTPKIIQRAAATVPERYRSMRDATLLKNVVLPSESVSPIKPAAVATFEKAVAEARTGKRFKGKPDVLACHEIALADVFRHEEALLERWRSMPERFSFDQAVSVARWMAHRGKPDEAWDVLRGKISQWYPVAICQIAPVVLLVDPILAKVMTPPRCAELLATPRGPEAAGAS